MRTSKTTSSTQRAHTTPINPSGIIAPALTHLETRAPFGGADEKRQKQVNDDYHKRAKKLDEKLGNAALAHLETRAPFGGADEKKIRMRKTIFHFPYIG